MLRLSAEKLHQEGSEVKVVTEWVSDIKVATCTMALLFSFLGGGRPICWLPCWKEWLSLMACFFLYFPSISSVWLMITIGSWGGTSYCIISLVLLILRCKWMKWYYGAELLYSMWGTFNSRDTGQRQSEQRIVIYIVKVLIHEKSHGNKMHDFDEKSW